MLEMFLVLGETFVIENAVSAVAFIAKLIREAALLREVRRFVSMCEKMRVVGSVRAFRSRGAVGAVAVAAVNKRRNGHRGFQTGHIAVDAGRGDRMEGGARWIEFQARVRLGDLPGNRGLDPARIVCVTFETHLVLVLDLLGGAARDSNAGDPPHRTGYDRRLCGRVLDSMGIMTIYAFNMSCGRNR